MTSLTIFTCDGCGTTKEHPFAAIENPMDWGHVSVVGPRSAIDLAQMKWVGWRNEVGRKLYCSDCITAMTGVPLP